MTLVATHDPPPKGIPNPIHSDDGATSSGYAGSLVAGVRTYGWAVDEVVSSAGEQWLDDGWIDFTLHRPVFVDDEVVFDATDGVLDVSTSNGSVLSGTFGVGDAPFLAELNPPAPVAGVDPPEVRPGYTLESAPIGQPLMPLSVHISRGASERLVTEDLGLEAGDWADRIHPYFLAARMSPITRHNFTYGPTIHVRTQMQHLGPVASDQTLTINARIVEVYDRKGHWYQVLDGEIVASANSEASSFDCATPVARLRHHTIFRPRPGQ